MRNKTLLVVLFQMSIAANAQQISVPPPPRVMLINDRPVNQPYANQSLSSLVSKYKAAKPGHTGTGQQDLVKDFESWWTYTSQNIHLSQDFTALAPDSAVITKKRFLQLLTTGAFYPVKIDRVDEALCYRLVLLPEADKAISNATIQLAGDALYHYEMEGKNFPPFRFYDINNREYNSTNTKGKIVVFKCWFIHCEACVKEFPDLNQLVEKYKNRKDILFVSLAFDRKNELVNFLKLHPFLFSVVPSQEQFLTQKLGITSYPTHIIVGKDGRIEKVVDNSNDLAATLGIAASKK